MTEQERHGEMFSYRLGYMKLAPIMSDAQNNYVDLDTLAGYDTPFSSRTFNNSSRINF
jgi:hypothetical protein